MQKHSSVVSFLSSQLHHRPGSRERWLGNDNGGVSNVDNVVDNNDDNDNDGQWISTVSRLTPISNLSLLLLSKKEIQKINE